MGSRLLQLLIETAEVTLPPEKGKQGSGAELEPKVVPAFSHSIDVRKVGEKKRLQRFGVVRCHDAVLRQMEANGEVRHPGSHNVMSCYLLDEALTL